MCEGETIRPKSSGGGTLPDELEFRHLLDKWPTAVYICDASGLITYFNRHAEELWGRAPKLRDPEDRYCGSFKLFSPQGVPIPHDACWMALALRRNREYIDQEIVVERQNGERITVLAHASPVQSSSGMLLGAVNTLVDITDRKRAELMQLELASIIDSANDAIISKTLDGTIVTWNQGAEKLYGYTAAEAIGKPISILLPADRADELPAIMERLRRGERIEHYETKRRRKDGRTIDVSVAISPVITAAGEVIRASAVARDITTLKEIEAERGELLAREQAARGEAERANKVKDQFLAMVSHDLRSPVQCILLSVQLLRSEEIRREKMAQVLDLIERTANAQASLIGDLLDASSMLAGRLQLDMCSVDLTSVVTAAVDTVRLQAEAKGIEMQTQIDTELRPIHGDAKRLRQVVLNLLSNAVYFTPHGGRIQIRVSRNKSDVEIIVSDTGVGIELDFLPHVFKPFYQEDISGQGKSGGLGLGLGIVHHLVELHGGSVSVESSGRGQGATFTVRLPADPGTALEGGTV